MIRFVGRCCCRVGVRGLGLQGRMFLPGEGFVGLSLSSLIQGLFHDAPVGSRDAWDLEGCSGL